jgi:hypothetical protein
VLPGGAFDGLRPCARRPLTVLLSVQGRTASSGHARGSASPAELHARAGQACTRSTSRSTRRPAWRPTCAWSGRGARRPRARPPSRRPCSGARCAPRAAAPCFVMHIHASLAPAASLPMRACICRGAGGKGSWRACLFCCGAADPRPRPRRPSGRRSTLPAHALRRRTARHRRRRRPRRGRHRRLLPRLRQRRWPFPRPRQAPHPAVTAQRRPGLARRLPAPLLRNPPQAQ